MRSSKRKCYRNAIYCELWERNNFNTNSTFSWKISFPWKLSSALSKPTTGWVWHSPMLLETNDTNKRHLSQILKITPSPSAECPPDIGEIKEDPCIRRLFFQTLSSCSIIQNDHRVTINFCVLWNKLWDWRLIHCSWSRNSTVHLWLAPVLIRKPTLKAGSH